MTGFKHGHNTRLTGRSRTYNSWMAMRIRVKHKPQYLDVQIDSRWDSFSAFLEDMGERPEGMTLDRIDGRLGYTAANCRWATPTTQSRNKVKFTGVRWAKQQRKFIANIGVDCKVIHLGYRDDWFEAVCLRKSAENTYWRES